MTPTETAAILRQFNEWRRGDYAPEDQPTQPDPVEIGEAIDAAVEMIDRLEAAEKERDDVAQQLVQSEIGKREISEARDALQVEVGKLKDLEVARCVKINGYIVDNARLVEEVERLRAKIAEMEKQEPVATVIKEGDSRYWMSERLWTFPNGKYPLYALPGAQSVPDVDALAQLIREIDDKHQLGAGALAERIVEWLAAAPEAKP